MKTLNGTDFVPYTVYYKVEGERNALLDTLNSLGLKYGENPKDKVISIDFLLKELVDAMCDRKISSDQMSVVHQIISRWRNG